MSNAIHISHLTKCYASKRKEPTTALSDVSLVVPQGSFFGLLGPNGAGKSTLINIMAGLVKKTSGEVVINGVDQDIHPTQTRQQLGIVPQEVVLDPFFTVAETLEYYAGYFGVKKADRITMQLLKDLHLSDKADVNSRRLSGGMKRRVLIAKALVHRPAILVLDEPTAGVDVELRDQLWKYVQKLNQQGTTVLLTTHYLEEAEALCDHVAIINHGQIIANDSMRNIKQQFGVKQVAVRFSQTIDPVSLPAIEGSSWQGDTLLLPYRTGQEVAQDIASLAGFPIADIHTQETDLESIFKKLVA